MKDREDACLDPCAQQYRAQGLFFIRASLRQVSAEGMIKQDS